MGSSCHSRPSILICKRLTYFFPIVLYPMEKLTFFPFRRGAAAASVGCNPVVDAALTNRIRRHPGTNYVIPITARYDNRA